MHKPNLHGPGNDEASTNPHRSLHHYSQQVVGLALAESLGVRFIAGKHGYPLPLNYTCKLTNAYHADSQDTIARRSPEWLSMS